MRIPQHHTLILSNPWLIFGKNAACEERNTKLTWLNVIIRSIMSFCMLIIFNTFLLYLFLKYLSRFSIGDVVWVSPPASDNTKHKKKSTPK